MAGGLETSASSDHKRRWWIRGLVSGVVVLFAGLGIYSYFAKLEAQESQGAAEASQEAEKKQKLVAEQNARRAKDEAIAAKNSLLISVVRSFSDSPSEAAAMLREVESSDPTTVLGWSDAASSVAFQPRNLRLILGGEKKKISTAIFGPEGEHVLTVSRDGTVRIWNADGSGEPIGLEKRVVGIEGAAFSPDGHRVRAVLTRGIILDWNIFDIRTSLWRSSSFCHSGRQRMILLGEDESLAKQNHRRCQRLIRLCESHSEIQCKNAVDAEFSISRP